MMIIAKRHLNNYDLRERKRVRVFGRGKKNEREIIFLNWTGMDVATFGIFTISIIKAPSQDL